MRKARKMIGLLMLALMCGCSSPANNKEQSGEKPMATPTQEATGEPEVTGALEEVTGMPELTGTPETTGVPEVTGEPEATVTPEVTGTPELTLVPTKTPTATLGNTHVYANGTTNTLPTADANGKKIAIDAGHQQRGISDLEPNGPGSSEMKKKLTSGTAGVATGLAEYVLNLQVSMYLKQELLDRGYEVFMIRENHDCPISNAERAVEANESGADVFVRVHANSASNASARGGLTMVPSGSNAYVGHLAADSMRLGTQIADAMNRASGFQNRGVSVTDTMTGINWCSIPVTIVEMGFMSNAEEDRLMAQEHTQRAIARGIADGIDAYFGF